MLSFFAIDPPADISADSVAATLRLLPQFAADAFVEVEAQPGTVNAKDDPLTLFQGYLQPSPLGIDVMDAWNTPSGDGSGMQFVFVC